VPFLGTIAVQQFARARCAGHCRTGGRRYLLAPEPEPAAANDDLAMTTLSFLVALSVRCLLVLLFLPFSAADKIFNFSGAVRQAREMAPSTGLARALILAGLFVEIVMSLGVVTGVADRLAGFVLAGYCGTTALLWKQFWKPGDFWAGGEGRALFWDFLKNFSLAAGFLLVTFGTSVPAVQDFLANPTLSSHPYRVRAPAP
jgi:putative oxidoreductase